MKKYLSLLYIGVIILLGACSPSRFVKPLQKNQKSVGMELGGPLFRFGEDKLNNKNGMIIPVPFATVTGGYGIKNDLTGFASLHLTSLAFQNVHLELGAVKQFYSNADSSIGITATPQLNIIYGMAANKLKIFPQVDINAYWHYQKGKQHFAYAGISNWLELASTRAHGEKQTTHWIPNLHIGHQFSRPKMDYFMEFKYLAPFSSNQNIVIDYWKPLGNKNGAFGAYIGLRKKF